MLIFTSSYAILPLSLQDVSLKNSGAVLRKHRGGTVLYPAPSPSPGQEGLAQTSNSRHSAVWAVRGEVGDGRGPDTHARLWIGRSPGAERPLHGRNQVRAWRAVLQGRHPVLQAAVRRSGERGEEGTPSPGAECPWGASQGNPDKALVPCGAQRQPLPGWQSRAAASKGSAQRSPRAGVHTVDQSPD